ncbi:MAG: rRNA maturation RNase YbeY [Patescibacteria group bacterium]|nr:rRNA maturation RNase YbeY [Patescibacteria group bacterium]
MNCVLISSESRYPINRRRIKETINNYLKAVGLDEVEVSVAVVGTRKIIQLNREWRKLDEPTTVLTFGLEEPRDEKGVLRLGDIVISYPEARILGQEDNLRMDEVIDKLLVHGLNNLLGKTKNEEQFLSQISAPKNPGS